MAKNISLNPAPNKAPIKGSLKLLPECRDCGKKIKPPKGIEFLQGLDAKICPDCMPDFASRLFSKPRKK